MKTGIAVASEVDSWKVVQRAEALGLGSAWFYDTQLLNPDVFICMALAAANTQTIRLGTGVLIPSNRIEPVAANALATLNRIAPGRIDFGVGTGFTGRRTMGLAAIPLASMRTYIERVQGLLRGQTIEWDFEGEQRQIRFLNPEFGLINVDDPIPLHISAFGPKARALTAELGAGWINFSGDTDGAVRALRAMQQAWQAAGRSTPLRSTLFFLGAVLTGDAAEDDRRLVAQGGPATAVMFHNMVESLPPGDNNLPPALAETLAAYRTHYARYEPSEARYLENHRGHLMFLREEEKPLITPELVRATTMSGTKAELVTRLRKLRDAGYDELVVQLVSGEEAAVEDWADVFNSI